MENLSHLRKKKMLYLKTPIHKWVNPKSWCEKHSLVQTHTHCQSMSPRLPWHRLAADGTSKMLMAECVP